MEPYALVLFSGGMDSTIALYHARRHFTRVDALTFAYGQRSRSEELRAAGDIFWLHAKHSDKNGQMHYTKILTENMWSRPSSILTHGTPIRHYGSNEDAVKGTDDDPAYLPGRNAVFISIAAHFLVCKRPDVGGTIVTGNRSRLGGGGFPDCTKEFHDQMTVALSTAMGLPIVVSSPLNELETTRVASLKYAMELEGCLEALRYTVTCFAGKTPPCGKCLPCHRRAHAFAQVGIKDPAL